MISFCFPFLIWQPSKYDPRLIKSYPVKYLIYLQSEKDLWFAQTKMKVRKTFKNKSLILCKFPFTAIIFFLFKEDDGRQNLNARRIISTSAKQFAYSWDCHRCGSKEEKKRRRINLAPNVYFYINAIGSSNVTIKKERFKIANYHFRIKNSQRRNKHRVN